jgi:archaellum biogenesis ATPase FlaH
MKRRNQHPAVTFFKRLFRDCGEGYIDLRFLPSGENLFIPLSKIDSIPNVLKKYKGQNAYFGVATRIKGNGTKDGILQIPALGVDIDFNGRSPKAVWKKLRDFQLRPSVIIKTGGGYHVYWFLKRPAAKDQIPEIECLLKQLASSLDGDMGATDASRILRIPGTLNLKRDRFPVHLIRFRPTRKYKISDFKFLSPRIEKSKHSAKPIAWADRVLLNGVSEGERNNTITKLAGRYVRKELSKIESLPILLEANRQFEPSLPEKEVIKILDSVNKTHIRKNANEEVDDKGIDYQLTTLADVYDYPEPTFLIDPILPQENLLILGGEPKVGKSFVAMSIAKAVLTGNPLWGKFPVKKIGAVLYIDLETSKPEFKKRFQSMKFDLNLPISFIHLPKKEVYLDKDVCLDALMTKIEEVNPLLIIIDSLIRIHEQRENESTGMSRVMKNLRKLVKSGTTLLVIHHHRKGEGPANQMLRGSSDIKAAIDIEYALTRKDQSLVFKSIGSRSKPVDPLALEMIFEEKNIEVRCHGAEVKNEKILSEIFKVLDEKKKTGIAETRRKLTERNVGIGQNSLRDILHDAANRKILLENIGPNGKKLYRLNPASGSRVHAPIYRGKPVKQRAAANSANVNSSILQVQ